MGKSSDKIKTRAKCKTIDAYIQRIHGTTVTHIPPISEPVCVYVRPRFVPFDFLPSRKYRLTLIIDAFVLYLLFIYITKNQMEEENGKLFLRLPYLFYVKGLQNLILVQTISIADSCTR